MLAYHTHRKVVLVLSHADERARLVANIAGHLKQASPVVQARQLEHFARAHSEYGAHVAAALGLPVPAPAAKKA